MVDKTTKLNQNGCRAVCIKTCLWAQNSLHVLLMITANAQLRCRINLVMVCLMIVNTSEHSWYMSLRVFVHAGLTLISCPYKLPLIKRRGKAPSLLFSFPWAWCEFFLKVPLELGNKILSRSAHPLCGLCRLRKTQRDYGNLT